MKIWIDDMRPIPKGYDIHLHSFEEAKNIFQKNKDGKITIVDFDHDLGEKLTGYDIAKYIVEHNIPIEGFRVHSMNPVGGWNIRQLLKKAGYKEV